MGTDIYDRIYEQLKALGLTPLEASRLTLYEFRMYQLAYEVKTNKEMELISFQAWQNNRIKAQKNIGSNKKPKYEPYFKNFKEFYDSEKTIDIIFYGKEEEQKQYSIADLNRRINKKRG